METYIEYDPSQVEGFQMLVILRVREDLLVKIFKVISYGGKDFYNFICAFSVSS